MTDCTDRKSMASRQAYTKARGKIYSGHNEKYLVIQWLTNWLWILEGGAKVLGK